jgi:hypothetical protein
VVSLTRIPTITVEFRGFQNHRNTIEKFLHVDMKQLGGFDHRMGKILVEMDTFEGLLEDIDINW